MADFDFVETDSAKLYTAILGELMNSCGEPLYPGDERRIFGEGLVLVFTSLFNEFNDKMKQRTLDNARGVVLDALGKRYDVYRAEAASAYATFRFSVDAAQDENIIIPAGTRITSDGNIYFATQDTAVLIAGETAIDLLGVCTVGGSDYNGFTPGSISSLVDLIPCISAVSNTTMTMGGDDGEPYTLEGDAKFRERIRLAPGAMSTAGPEVGYRFFALSADPDIIDVAIDCPEDEPNTVNIYPIMSGGKLPDDDVLAKVLVACSADKRRPMTDHVSAIAPEAVEYSVELKYYCTKDDEAALIQAIEGEGGAIDQYNEWQTAAMDRDIDPDQLRSFIFAAKAESTATGTVRMDITKPTFTKISKTQVAKLKGPLTVTHEVVTV